MNYLFGINVLSHAILVFVAFSCAHKYWLSTSRGIPALNDDVIELRIKRDLPVS